MTVSLAVFAALIGLALLIGVVGSAVVRRLSNPVGKYRKLYLGVLLPLAVLAYIVLRVVQFGHGIAGLVLPDATSLFGLAVADFAELLGAGIVGLAAYAPTVPGVRAVRDIDLSTGHAVIRMGRYILALSVLVTVLIVPLNTGVHSIAMLGLFVVFVVGFQAAAPWLIPLLRSTRQPDEASADRLDGLCDRAYLSVRDTRLLETDTEETASVTVRGLPGYRRLFMTSTFLDVFDDETATALLTIQAGRIRANVLARTVSSLLVALVPVFTLLGDLGPMVPLVGASLGVVVLGLWLTRRGVRSADDYAAERLGADAVAEALERYAEFHDLQPTRRRLPNPLARTPALGDRIDRLREQ